MSEEFTVGRWKECTDLDCPICDNLYNSAKTTADLYRACFTCDCYDDGNGGARAWFTLGDWKRRLANIPNETPTGPTVDELLQRILTLEQIILDITADIRTQPYLDVGDIRAGVTSKRASRDSQTSKQPTPRTNPHPSE